MCTRRTRFKPDGPRYNFQRRHTMAERMVDKVMRITQKPKFIRNICTSAHIHHGKTAFTDNLLAAAGMMSEKAAGDLEAG
ncbi:MAG TPA: GTP-binding protein, partial [Candidatus Nanoarchaeia archaeon]|nr:GTP-binding protein [Candidatus Nanoarchaeia archaeon]